jgi:hypothetical protein
MVELSTTKKPSAFLKGRVLEPSSKFKEVENSQPDERLLPVSPTKIVEGKQTHPYGLIHVGEV